MWFERMGGEESQRGSVVRGEVGGEQAKGREEEAGGGDFCERGSRWEVGVLMARNIRA